MEWNSTADEEDDIWCINCLINLYKRRHPTTPHLVWPPLGPNDDLLRLILLSVIFFYHLRSTTVWEFSKKMCTGHQYKEHLWKINSQRRVADGIDGQYIFRFSWKLIFQLQQKCKHQKGNLSQPLKMSQMLMDVKGKLMKKCHFWILQISSSLFSQFKNLLQWQIMVVGTKWKRIQIFYEGNDITQILASFPPLCNWTALLWTGSGRHASAIIPTSTKMQSAPLCAGTWSLLRAWGFP